MIFMILFGTEINESRIGAGAEKQSHKTENPANSRHAKAVV